MKPKRIIIAALLLILPAAMSCKGPFEPKNIGILNWSEGNIGYKQAHKGIIDGLHANGYREGFNIQIDYQNAGGRDAEAKRMLDGFVHKRYDLIVTIGSAACLAAVEAVKGTPIPVVFAVVSQPRESGIIDDWQSSKKNATGVSIDIPIEPYLNNLKNILPNAKHIGIIYLNKYATAIAAAREAQNVAPQFNLEPHMIALSENDLGNPEGVVDSIKSKIDAVFFPPDPTLYAEEMMKRFIPPFRNAGIPVVLISENYLKYGALFAISGNFYNIGRQTVPHITKVLSGVPSGDVPSEIPYDTVFTLNKKVADELKINLGWNVLIGADSIVE